MGICPTSNRGEEEPLKRERESDQEEMALFSQKVNIDHFKIEKVLLY